MANEWYYAHGKTKMGPFSPRQLKDLADAGTIVPNDTIWKDDLKEGVLASRVRHLFPHAASQPLQALSNAPPATDVVRPIPAELPLQKAAVVAIAAGVESPDKPSTIDVPENIILIPLEPPAAAKAPAKPPEKLVKKGRATAIKGADIVGQDGTHARYRKKCMQCGHKDSACHMIAISNKMMKMGYFCPKCRKNREVAIQCTMQ